MTIMRRINGRRCLLWISLLLVICQLIRAENSGSNDEEEEESHYLYEDDDAEPVMDYHGEYVICWLWTARVDGRATNVS